MTGAVSLMRHYLADSLAGRNNTIALHQEEVARPADVELLRRAHEIGEGLDAHLLHHPAAMNLDRFGCFGHWCPLVLRMILSEDRCPLLRIMRFRLFSRGENYGIA